jgi:hypothetical protein
MQRSKDSSRPKKVPAPTKTALRIERAKIAVPHPGVVFGHKHYIFIAKLKAGEIQALNHLSFAAKAAVTPLFEMWPPKKATKTVPAKPLTQHTADLMETLSKEWAGLACYVDTRYLGLGNVPSPAAVSTVFDIARNKSINVVPVTSPFYSQPFQQAIRGVIDTDGRGVMFRLPVSIFNDLPNLAGYLGGLAAVLGVTRNQVDILIDLEHKTNVVEVQQLGAYCLDNLPSVADWRTVTLASGCFPESLSDKKSGEWIPFHRADWVGWCAVVQQRANASLRVPSYGDYGVRCGGKPNDVPYPPLPNLRYSSVDTIWARKGLKEAGAMTGICADLIKRPYFSGAQFSQGDSEIALKAAMTNQKNGSPAQWIQWCTNHHLELTASQILNLP